jgi:ribosomal protein S19E (S16A)
MRAGEYCHGVRYPLLVDLLRDRGLLNAELHGVATRIRSLYERSGLRERLAGAYGDRVSRSAAPDPDVEAAADIYRRLERRVLERAGRPGLQALHAIVIEDRMTPAARSLPRALRAAEMAL